MKPPESEAALALRRKKWDQIWEILLQPEPDDTTVSPMTGQMPQVNPQSDDDEE